MDREQDADNITREVLIAVRRTFITPFDRGDVKDLITSMDNTIDQMQKTAKTIMLFDQRILHAAAEGDGRRDRRAAPPGAGGDPAAVSSINTNAGAHQQDQRADFADRGPRRRAARPRAAGALSRQSAVELDGVLHRRRDLRSSRESGRPLRRRRPTKSTASCSKTCERRPCTAKRRLRIDMDAVALALPILIALIVRGAGLRFPQRRCTTRPTRSPPSSRRACCGRRHAVLLGRLLQFRRLPDLRLACRPDRRHRHRLRRHRRPARGVRRADGRDRLEHHHLGARYSVIELARADRRAGRRRHRQGRHQGHRLGRPRQDHGGDRALAAHAASCWRCCCSCSCRGCSCATRPSRSTDLSARCNSSRPRSIRSATAATTPRRPWASSRCCSIRKAISAANSTCRSGSCSRATPRWGSAR